MQTPPSDAECLELVACRLDWKRPARQPGRSYKDGELGKICMVQASGRAMIARLNGASRYTSNTNGKAERFIQTSLREWAYARAYPTSEQRKNAFEPWIRNYD